jgi:hypothetical protein
MSVREITDRNFIRFTIPRKLLASGTFVKGPLPLIGFNVIDAIQECLSIQAFFAVKNS